LAAPLAPELGTALVPAEFAIEPPALAPAPLDPAVEVTRAEELGAPHAAITAVMLNVVKRTTPLVRAFFMCRSEGS
jgi:hypothetical protein